MGSIGIEWVKKYNGRANDVSNTQTAAEGFYNTLQGVRMFNWGDDLAWDQDFEESGQGTPSTGTDTSWVDNVDIVFYAGHGTANGPFFGTTNDSGEATPGEVRWGNRELEWITFHACEVLRCDGVFDRWGWGRFNGLHYILGFDTVCHDETIAGVTSPRSSTPAGASVMLGSTPARRRRGQRPGGRTCAPTPPEPTPSRITGTARGL